MSPEEIARRDRVRTAARERQRKHRALVKQRKLRELGLDMGNELVPGMDEVQYRAAADAYAHAQAQAVAQAHAHAVHHLGPPPPHELGQHPPPGAPGHSSPGGIPQEPPFPGGPGQLGGQTFASTLLLSFSCAPLLKAHLLRTLQMTNDELASLEPIIAQAWDQWDHNVRSSFQLEAVWREPSYQIFLAILISYPRLWII